MRVNWKDKALIAKVVARNTTQSSCLTELGLVDRGSNFKTLQRYIAKYNLNTKHFETKEQIYARTLKKRKLSFDEYLLTINPKGKRIREYMVAEGIEDKCSVCSQEPMWNGEPLTLQIDHIDGNHTNNSKDNLRIICPNCHTQTKTFGNKKN